jgi:hypothetical protein
MTEPTIGRQYLDGNAEILADETGQQRGDVMARLTEFVGEERVNELVRKQLLQVIDPSANNSAPTAEDITALLARDDVAFDGVEFEAMMRRVMCDVAAEIRPFVERSRR